MNAAQPSIRHVLSHASLAHFGISADVIEVILFGTSLNPEERTKAIEANVLSESGYYESNWRSLEKDILSRSEQSGLLLGHARELDGEPLTRERMVIETIFQLAKNPILPISLIRGIMLNQVFNIGAFIREEINGEDKQVKYIDKIFARERASYENDCKRRGIKATRRFEDRYVFIEHYGKGGEPIVMLNTIAYDGTPIADPLTIEAMKKLYQQNDGLYVPTGVKKRPALANAAALWIKQKELRITYETARFAPKIPAQTEREKQEDIDVFNTFLGYAHKAEEGNCLSFLDFIEETICDGDTHYYEYLINHLAWIRQHPYDRTHVCVVLTGEQGTGKTEFINAFAACLGEPYYKKVRIFDHTFLSRFNKEVEGILVAFLDDTTKSKDSSKKLTDNDLKELITATRIRTEEKHGGVHDVPPYFNFFAASNLEGGPPILLDRDARRYFVLRVNRKIESQDVWKKRVAEWRTPKFLRALAHFLENVDLSEHNPKQCPMTRHLTQMKLASSSKLAAAVFEWLAKGKTPDYPNSSAFPEGQIVHYKSIMRYMRERYGQDARATKSNTLKNDLRSMLGLRQTRENNNRVDRYPSLEEARAAFSEALRDEEGLNWDDSESIEDLNEPQGEF